MRKPYAILVTARDTHGSTYERTYFRGPMRLNKQAFTEWAIGNFLMLISEQFYDNLPHFVITGVTVLSSEEAFSIWFEEAEREIAKQRAAIEDWAKDQFKLPE